MLGDDHSAEREELLKDLEREEIELREAVDDLRRAVSRPFERIGQAVERPGPWLLAGVLIGVWLGFRRADGRRV